MNAAAFMAAVSCLPDLPPAGLAALDAGGVAPPPNQPAFCGDGLIDFDAGERCDPADGGAAGCSSDCRSVTCEGGLLDDATDHCYFALPAQAKYENATAACENAGGHLVTFVSEDEFGRIAQWKDAGFWVGLQFENAALAYKPPPNVNEPGWSGRCDGCFAHTDAGAKDFAKLPRDAGPRAFSCVVAGAASEPWFSIPCELVTFPLAVVCEREPVGATSHPCNGQTTCLDVRFTAGASRYLYFATAVPAQEASDSCKGLGGSLVVFETREEREQLAREMLTFLPKSPIPKVWIGLSRVNGAWTWANGLPVDKVPLEWADNQPRGGFWAAISVSESLYDTELATVDDGTTRLPYLCELTK